MVHVLRKSFWVEKKKGSFYKLSVSTLFAVYILILVGGIVRSTGSGMGCPDWPKCFGSWVPPTSINELPKDYKEVYSSYRAKKNIKFARYLSAFGFNETAQKLLNDKSILREANFNPIKTWIEYVNRMIGAVIGILIFSVFIFSLQYWKSQRALSVVACLTLLLVGFQGWLGSFVVSTNLTSWTVTVHMFLALLIVAMLLYLIYKSGEGSALHAPFIFWWVCACMTALLVQILLGTQVRGGIDALSDSIPRKNWIMNLGGEFIAHRSFSWVVLILHLGLIMKLPKTEGAKVFPLMLILLILGTILTGVGMAYFSVLPFLQPVHLLLATVTFGMQFLFLLKLKRKNKEALAY